MRKEEPAEELDLGMPGHGGRARAHIQPGGRDPGAPRDVGHFERECVCTMTTTDILIGEFIGAFIGATLVTIHYWDHFKETEDKGLKLAVYSTGPNIRNYGLNLVSEIIGTFVLVFVILAFGTNGSMASVGALGALP